MSVPLPSLSGSPFLSGWSLVGDLETGFNPYYGYLADAQRAQVQNNGKALTQQNANADSSRTGQWDNSQAFIGLSNPTYGTLTAGRVYSLSLDAINSYDPMGGSYAFSPIGYSGSYAGFGDTEAARAKTAVKYRLNFPNFGVLSASSFRVAGLWQFGGYDQGNGTNGMYQGQIGGDFNLFGGTPYAGTLSLDAVGDYAKDVPPVRRHALGRTLSVDGIGSWAKDAVNVGTFTGTCSVLKTGPYEGPKSGAPTASRVLQQHRRDGDAVEQQRVYAGRQVQSACPDGLRRLRVDQAGQPERQLSEWLHHHRRLERSCDDPLDFP